MILTRGPKTLGSMQSTHAEMAGGILPGIFGISDPLSFILRPFLYLLCRVDPFTFLLL